MMWDMSSLSRRSASRKAFFWICQALVRLARASIVPMMSPRSPGSGARTYGVLGTDRAGSKQC